MEGNPVICDHTDEPGGHNAQWTKSVTEGQTIDDSSYMGHLK